MGRRGGRKRRRGEQPTTTTTQPFSSVSCQPQLPRVERRLFSVTESSSLSSFTPTTTTTLQELPGPWTENEPPTDNGNSDHHNNTPSSCPWWQWAWQSWKHAHGKPADAPSIIQRHAWPILLPHENDDSPNTKTTTTTTTRWNLIAIAPTGSGKTLAYGLPLVVAATSCSSNKKKHGLIVVPTRELVQQVARELERTCKAVSRHGREKNPDHDTTSQSQQQQRQPVSTMVIPLHGGVPRQGQLDRLESLDLNHCACLVVATMGRLLDLLQGPKEDEKEENSNSNKVCSVSPNLSQLCHSLHTVVLDEADQLASNRDLCTQLTTLFASHMVVTDGSRPAPQMVLCSATWPDKVTPQWRSWLQQFSSSTTTHSNRPCAVLQVNSMATPSSSLPETMTTSTNTVASPTPNNNNMELSVHDPQANTYKDGCHEEVIPTEPEHTMETQSPNNNDDDNDNNTAKRPKHQWSDIPSHITQKLHVCAEHKKPRKLLTTLAQLGVYGKHAHPTKPKERCVSLGLVFFATIKALQQASKLLRKEGIACLELHSKLSQSTRERNIQTFSCGKIPLLLATDVAARGLHVQGIRYVIQYDFPGNLEQYVHRCGRAGRRRSGGAQQQQQQQQSATVYSFFTRNLAPLAQDMVALLAASHQWVDPNLLALTQTTPKLDKMNKTSKEKDERPTKNRKGMDPDNAPLHDSFQKKNNNNNQHDNAQEGGGTQQDHSNDQPNEEEEEEEEEEEDEYPSLALDRIVLKRASHVSDASSSSEDESSERE